MNEIPPLLIENIAKKNIVLFLGSGYLYNAVHPEGAKAPLGPGLADMISERFLGSSHNGSPLTFVSDLAISETSLFEVQSYIYGIFEKFSPNDSHLLFASLPWKAIFTTNYDFIVERSFQRNPKAIQELSVVIRNTPQQQIFRSPNTVPYYKLHGCLSNINDENLPLILSTEQYIDHMKNRDRLFSKLKELAFDFSILFVGYNNQDPNIRTILKELENLKEGKPRSFLVRPGITDSEIRYWESRKITPIKMGYEEFIKNVDKRITDTQRKLSQFRIEADKPIYSQFQVDIKELKPTENFVNFLENESEYIHSALSSPDSKPQAFYRGYFEDWGPIIKNLDVERHEKNRILTQLILEERYQKEDRSFLFIIKGYAGSGKSVLLKRLAWDASVEFDQFCIHIKNNTSLRYEPIIELYNYVKKRIYIFIDNTLNNEKGITTLLDKVEKNKIPITIVSTERTNNWNEDSDLKQYVTEEFAISYLTSDEIDHLISKLAQHNSLGYLENKSTEERRVELQEKAGRVLLVALHEATAGKPFEEIVLDEFNQLKSDQAKSLYLTVSILHRLGSEARAGLISRVHGINFNEFKEKLFDPLEFVVFSEKNYMIGDYVYKTRHPHIAEIIFETVLTDEQARYDEYLRILNYLDIDYKSDHHAFLAMTNARKLLEVFRNPEYVRNLFEIVEEKNDENPKLLQQKAIFEMQSTGGSLVKAEKQLSEALEISPNDPLISHSLAELCLKRAEIATNDVEKFKFLDKASKICYKRIKNLHNDSDHPYHTLLKIALMKLRDVIEKKEVACIEDRIKEMERLVSISKQKISNHEFLLEIEATFNTLINNEPKSLELLKKAHNINKATPFIALRYSKVLQRNNKFPEAKKVLKETLDLNPGNKDINFELAKLIQETEPQNEKDIIHYFRRSFTKGDSRYESQFWYARSNYIFNHIPEAKEVFDELSYVRLAPDIKNKPRAYITDDEGNLIKFEGSLIHKEMSYAFVNRDVIGDRIFIYRFTGNKNWDEYRIGSRISFNIGFNFKGAIAVNTNIL
jgi:hypothetical protein